MKYLSRKRKRQLDSFLMKTKTSFRFNKCCLTCTHGRVHVFFNDDDDTEPGDRDVLLAAADTRVLAVVVVMVVLVVVVI